ncbi:MAG: hypothetical protein RL722_696 [Pseudomonadota bacterium]|jgi:general secretion pathway protein L
MLLLLLPARPRQHPTQPGLEGADLASLAAASLAELHFVESADGQSVAESGRTAPALLARRSQPVIAALPEEALAWLSIRVPRAPAARLTAALQGLVEDQLLDEAEACHLALAPGARAGQKAWLAVTDRAWLAAQLAALQAAGLAVDRVVPLMAPPALDGRQEPDVDEPAGPGTATPAATGFGVAAPGALASQVRHIHVQTGAELSDADLPTGGGSSEDELVISVASLAGVASWPATGSLARRLLPDPLPHDCRLSATAAAAAAAEDWLTGPRAGGDLRVELLSRAERMLEAAAGGWNLRQFSLAAPRRGGTLLRAAWQGLRSPAWRPVRLGLAGLVLLQLIGLNAWAWQQRQALTERRAAMTQILRATHPQVRAVLDAPLQMARENEGLRAAAGKAGDADLETLMAAVASVWPANTPIQTLSFENGRLTLGTSDLRGPAAEAVASRLRPAGWQIEPGEGSLAIAKGGGSPAGRP